MADLVARVAQVREQQGRDRAAVAGQDLVHRPVCGERKGGGIRVMSLNTMMVHETEMTHEITQF